MKYYISILFSLMTACAVAQTRPTYDINPSLKQAAPVPSNCAAGKKWTTAGSGIAHCVAEDPTCTGGTYLVHDALGNPSCVAPVVVRETRTKSCGTGYTGKKYQERYKTTKPDGTVSYTAWDTYNDTCEEVVVEPPPVTGPTTPTTPSSCTNGATNYPSCNNNTTTSCSNGATNYPSCDNNNNNNNNNNDTTPTCSNGATNYPSCNNNPAPTCSNGATNYPSCNNNQPVSCPADYNYCIVKGQMSDTTIVEYGHYTYGPAPTCSKIKVMEGSDRYGSDDPGKNTCPAGY